MARLFRIIVGLLLIPAAYAVAYETYLFIDIYRSILVKSWFIYGTLIYVLFFTFFYGDTIRFLESFEHELGHTIVAYLTFGKVKKFHVNLDNDSEVVATSPVGLTWLTRLAPYFLPVFTLPFLLMKPFMFGSGRNIVDLLIGFTLGFHYLGLVREFRLRQTDIQHIGLIFSLVVTVIVNFIFLLIILTFVLDNRSFISQYFGRVYDRALDNYAFVLEKWRSFVSS